MATDRQIAQLVLQVDANIAVAQRELGNLARVVKQQTGDINNSLATTEVAHQRMGRAFGQARIAQMELSHVVTASVDAYAAGFSPLRIMTLEMGRLAEAATFLGGGGGGVLGKVAGFMSGPWGIAVLLGVSVMAQLIGKMGQSGESIDALVDKMRKQAQQAQANEEADRIWASTLDGVTEALRKNREELDKLGDADKSAAQKALANAIAARDRLSGIISETAANIDLARSLYEVQKARSSGPGQRGEIATLGLDSKLGALDAFQSRLATAQGKLAEANRQIEEATSRVYTEVARSDPTELIKKRYDRLIEAARQRAVAEHKVGDELIRQVAALEKQRAAEIKALQAKPKGSGESGKQISFDDAAAIARGAGLTVTSAYRSTSHQAALYNDPSVNRPGNPVARPGTSAHEGINGKWALDIAFAPGLSAQSLKKLYGDQGVSLSAVYKEKGHFHIEGSRSQAAAAERQAAAEEARAIKAQDAFEETRDRLNRELLQAQAQLVQGVSAQAAFAEDMVRQDQQDRDSAIQHDVAEKKLTQAEADQLKAINAKVAEARIQAIEIRKQTELISQQDESLQQALGRQEGDLRFADEMATTQAEHRQLQLQILDIVYQEKEAHLKALKAQLALADAIGNAAKIADIDAQLANLPNEKSQDQARVHQGTMDPLEAWAKTVPQTAAQINEALRSIEVQGIENLASSITDVITGTKSLGAAFKDIANEIIADIIRMTIRMLIFRAISAIGSAIAGGAGGGGGDAFSGVESTFPGGSIPGFADGGMFSVGGHAGVDSNVLSINGVPRAKVSANENIAVIPRMRLSGAGGAGGGAVEVHVVVEPSEDLMVKAAVVADQRIRAHEPRIVRNAATTTARSLTRPRLMGGR